MRNSRRNFLVVGVLTLVLAFAVYAVLEAMIKVDGRTGEKYYCDEDNTDPYCACMSAIGEEEWCHGNKNGGDEETGVSWGSGCIDELCTAWTTCADGERVECTGEYKAQADEAGVRCLDTGDAIASSDYCD